MFFNSPNKVFIASATVTSPPGSPNSTDIYIVPSGATGAWSGQTGKFTRYNTGSSSWDFLTPYEGTLVWALDTSTFYLYASSTWGIPNATAAGSGTINTGTSGNLAIYTGSTALDDLAKGTSNQLLGVNNAGTAHEYKTLNQGSNITITHGANSITIAAASGTAPPFTDTTSIVQGSADNTKQIRFEVDGLTTGTTRVLTPPDSDGTLVLEGFAQTLTNKTINASNNTLSNITEAMLSFSDVTTLNVNTSRHGFAPKAPNDATLYLDGTGNYSTPAGSISFPVVDTQTLVKGSADATKLLRFEVDGFTTGTTRVATWPDADITVVGTGTTQTLTNKTIDASSNTLSNISESMLSFSDVTTLNVNTSRHGFAPKAPNDATKYLDGTGNYSTPAGTGPTLPFADNQDLFKNNADNTKLVRFNLASIATGTTRTFTFPNVDDTLVTLTANQTLTNKTLTTPTIGSFANAGHDHSNAAGGGNLTPTAFGLTDPNANRILFWNDSTNLFDWLTLGTNLSITGTTLNAASGSGGSPGGSGTELQYRGGASTFNAVTGSSVTTNGYITLAPTAVSTGSPTLLTITGPTHTTLTANEYQDLNFNLNRTVQFTGSTGFATERVVLFQMPTLAFQNATGTITNAIGVEFDSPKQGTNASLTHSTAVRIKPSATAHHGLWIDSPVSADGDGFALGVAGTKVIVFKHVSGATNAVFNAPSTLSDTATNGFIYIPQISSSNSPSGSATTYVGAVPLVVQRNAIEGFFRLWTRVNTGSSDNWVNLTPFYSGGTGNPTIAGNTAAGTSPTISISGKNGAHEITLTPGSSPAASASVFTVTFNNTAGSFVVTPYPILTPSNSNAAALSGNAQVYVSSRSTTTYVVSVGSTALVQGSQYKWLVHCFN